MAEYFSPGGSSFFCCFSCSFSSKWRMWANIDNFVSYKTIIFFVYRLLFEMFLIDGTRGLGLRKYIMNYSILLQSISNNFFWSVNQITDWVIGRSLEVNNCVQHGRVLTVSTKDTCCDASIFSNTSALQNAHE